MARRRGFGEVERRVGASKTGDLPGPVRDAGRHPLLAHASATKMDAEAWLATERSLIDRDTWTPPPAAQDRGGETGPRGVVQHGRRRSPSAT